MRGGAVSGIGGRDLVVFDEPTTALDVTTQIEVIAAIKDAIRDEGMAAIYITHDLALVAQIADRLSGSAASCAGFRASMSGSPRPRGLDSSDCSCRRSVSASGAPGSPGSVSPRKSNAN